MKRIHPVVAMLWCALLSTASFAQDSLSLKVGKMAILGADMLIGTFSLEYPVTPGISVYVRTRPEAVSYFFDQYNYHSQLMVGGKAYLHPRTSAFPGRYAGVARGLYVMPYYADRQISRLAWVPDPSDPSDDITQQYSVHLQGVGGHLGYQTWLGKSTRFSRSLFADFSVGAMYHLKSSYALGYPAAPYTPKEYSRKFTPMMTATGGLVLGRNPESAMIHRIRQESKPVVPKGRPMAADSVFPINLANNAKVGMVELESSLYRQDKSHFLALSQTAADSALVKLFFRKRKINNIISSCLAFTLVGVNSNVSYEPGLTVVPIEVMISAIGVVLILESVIYSRHNLYCYLHEMANLPPKIRKKLLADLEKDGLLLP